MKKRIFIINMVMLFTISNLLACSSNKDEVIKESSNKVNKSDNLNLDDDKMTTKENDITSKESITEYLNNLSVENNERVDNIIPTYEEDLLLNNDLFVYLGRDAGFYNGYSARFDDTRSILSTFPTKAIRKTSTGHYAMCDSNSGFRLFLFFNNTDNQEYTLSGFPIIMKKVLSYNDFKLLSIGDSIDKVQKIDPVIEQYREHFDKATDEFMDIYTKKGAGAISVHLLSDGILKIVYKREKKDYIITDLVYSDNYKLQCFSGQISYEINRNDYKQ